MRQWVVGFWILAVGCLMSGCSGAEAEYSTWPCRFAFDRLNPTLTTSLNAGSRGVFCLITEQVQKGRKYLLFQNNIGLTSEPEPETAEEVQAKFILGLNNGIIVGFQTLITDPYGGFVAYDVQCPNCVRNENNTINPNYRVTMDTKGIATCPKCKKTYDMNNGGIITNGSEGDTGLEKYVAITDGMHVSVFRR